MIMLQVHYLSATITNLLQGGATHVDIACDKDLVKLAMDLTNLPICVSSVDPSAFHSAVQAGAKMVEIGNYDSFYEMGIEFSSEQILKLTRETRKMLPDITLSVTVPHTLSLPDQVYHHPQSLTLRQHSGTYRWRFYNAFSGTVGYIIRR
ncbi:thiamine monophosphate synthase [Zea mays]|uniref:Uncharacterized protein ycf23 n=1 Tax=Zea mays TaxID=4577 RepID=A0A1D6MCX8_MAIZE|nr:thiamine monophosphate synthase [Zea mays]